MPAAFSRLQLAAALIEYDNDPDNPDAPYRSAQQSALFSHLRRNPAARPDLHSRQSDYLGVNLPADEEGRNGRESALGTRRSRGSRGSLDALRNPFGADENSDYGDDAQEQVSDMEVDLAQWGLDAFIPKDKSKKGKDKRVPTPTLTAVQSRTISERPNDVKDVSGLTHSRAPSSLSLGGMRRHSTSSRLDLGEGSQYPAQRQRAASQSTILMHSHQDSVPFPSGRVQSPTSDPNMPPQEEYYPPRSQSRASLGSRPLLDEPRRDDEQVRQRTFSDETHQTPVEDNPFALGPPTQTSRFDPKAAALHARTYSNASLGTRNVLDNDAMSVQTGARESVYPRDRPYSVYELLRPKVLVMPSPLQHVGPADGDQTRDGFQLSKDGPPLPPEARNRPRRLSTHMDAVPNPSNSFIPNPSADLSLAQKVFRNTLVTNHSGLYTDADNLPPRATADGEQIEFDPAPAVEEDNHFYGENQGPKSRPTGKLYGKSLIDDLEARKAQMRSKQRVFTGDQRPSMMARETNRASTLIDPATLKNRPNANRQSSYGSTGIAPGMKKPLLNFDDEDQPPQQLGVPSRPPQSRSVFGVDTLWEKEMAKLREIQEQERIEEEARKKAEAEEARLKAEKEKKKRKKKKGRGQVPADDVLPAEEVKATEELEAEQGPPTLPNIEPVIVRRKVTKLPEDDDDNSDSDSDEETGPAKHQAAPSAAWHSDSEDEKPAVPEGPVRTTGVGLRNPQPRRVGVPDDESDEDIPLTAAMQRVVSRNTRMLAAQDSDEDEDKPLSRVIQESKSKSSALNIDFDNLYVGSNNANDDDDEDSQPLGLRASRMVLNNQEDEDDKPLAFHPEQQRRTQYQLLAQAQAQQQHQSMMMQAQFQNSMFFNSPMMNPPMMAPSPFFGPQPMMNPLAMMQAPIPVPSPPPIHDESKFHSVDKWRRDVVVDR